MKLLITFQELLSQSIQESGIIVPKYSRIIVPLIKYSRIIVPLSIQESFSH